MLLEGDEFAEQFGGLEEGVAVDVMFFNMSNSHRVIRTLVTNIETVLAYTYIERPVDL